MIKQSVPIFFGKHLILKFKLYIFFLYHRLDWFPFHSDVVFGNQLRTMDQFVALIEHYAGPSV